MLFCFTTNDNGLLFIPFDKIVRKFLRAKMPGYMNRQTYFQIWDNGEEAMELVLYDFIKNEYDGKVDTPESFNKLVNALIIYLQGGDARPVLSADAEQLYQFERQEQGGMTLSLYGPSPVDSHAIKFWTRALGRTGDEDPDARL